MKLSRTEVKEINKRVTNKWKRKHELIISAPRRGYLQADLIDMSNLASKKGNKNFKWILTIIDIYSRKVWAFPAKNKRPSTILPLLQQFISDASKKVSLFKIQTDDGNEFKGPINSLLKSNNIIHRTVKTGDHNTQGMIERFNQTLRRRFQDLFVENNSLVWLPYLKEIIDDYNSTIHSSIQAKPANVWNGKEYPLARTKSVPTLKPGDNVRVLLKKAVFDKKSQTQSFSKNVYTVLEPDGGKYKLVGKSGRYARWQLLKTRFKPKTIVGRDIRIELKERKRTRSRKRKLKQLDINKLNIRFGRRKLRKK